MIFLDSITTIFQVFFMSLTILRVPSQGFSQHFSYEIPVRFGIRCMSWRRAETPRCRWWEKWPPWAPLREEKSTHTLQLGFFRRFFGGWKKRWVLIGPGSFGIGFFSGKDWCIFWGNRPWFSWEHWLSRVFVEMEGCLESLGLRSSQRGQNGWKMWLGKWGPHGWKITSRF